ncbi:MAG: aspartate-semialdehyde dehydrogenase [Candidatus Bathyarchaeia archaeon]
MRRVKVAILGATGMAGQEYVSLLAKHPFFEISCLTGKTSVGKHYAECAKGLSIPPSIANMEVKPTEPDYIEGSEVAFSPLPAEAAKEIEPKIARIGTTVISDSSCHRMEADVPLLIPDVNPEHLDLIHIQRELRGWSGTLVTTPNCTAVGLVTVLKPIYEGLGIKKVVVTTMQAISGAGYPGVPSYDIIDNIIPFIEGEEEKVSSETHKILGHFDGRRIESADFPVEVSCNRVPTLDGHLESVYLETEEDASPDVLSRLLSEYRSVPQEIGLPSAPAQPIVVLTERDRPQPRLDRMAGTVPGMSVVVGRIRQASQRNQFMLTLLSHNRIRGASGSAVLLGELMYVKGYLGM